MKNHNPFYLVLVVAIMLLVGFIADFKGVDRAERKAGLEGCQAKLPRDQICVLVAIPKSSLSKPPSTTIKPVLK